MLFFKYIYYSSGKLLNSYPGLKVNRCINIFCMEVVFTAKFDVRNSQQ